MASIFGDDGVDDLLNENLVENQNLPSDDDENQEPNGSGENLFADGDEDNDKEGGADVEAKPVKVEPKKRSSRNPRPRLTVETLRGPRGIHTIEEYFKDIKFQGKGHEKRDLDEVMRRLQHWGHRMYPTYKFDDILANIDRLGKKKPLQVHMSRYRLGMLQNLNMDEPAVDDEEDAAGEAADEPFDEFDALLGEQIAISRLAPRTPAASTSRQAATSANLSTAGSSITFATPSFDRESALISTPYTRQNNFDDMSDLATPLPPSQPSTPAPASKLSAEQMAKIAENRRLAQERLRAAKALQQQK